MRPDGAIPFVAPFAERNAKDRQCGIVPIFVETGVTGAAGGSLGGRCQVVNDSVSLGLCAIGLECLLEDRQLLVCFEPPEAFLASRIGAPIHRLAMLAFRQRLTFRHT